MLSGKFSDIQTSNISTDLLYRVRCYLKAGRGTMLGMKCSVKILKMK